MKTSNTILCSIAGVVLVVAVILAVRLWPQTLRDDECSPLYQRYCHTPGIEASYVKGFRINDTLFVNVTLLQAKNSAGWERLLNDFHLVNAIDTNLYSQSQSFCISLVSKDDPTKKTGNPDEPLCSRVAFPYEREIHIYSTENDDHRTALHKYLLLNLSKQQTPYH